MNVYILPYHSTGRQFETGELFFIDIEGRIRVNLDENHNPLTSELIAEEQREELERQSENITFAFNKVLYMQVFQVNPTLTIIEEEGAQYLYQEEEKLFQINESNISSYKDSIDRGFYNSEYLFIRLKGDHSYKKDFYRLNFKTKTLDNFTERYGVRYPNPRKSVFYRNNFYLKDEKTATLTKHDVDYQLVWSYRPEIIKEDSFAGTALLIVDNLAIDLYGINKSTNARVISAVDIESGKAVWTKEFNGYLYRPEKIKTGTYENQLFLRSETQWWILDVKTGEVLETGKSQFKTTKQLSTEERQSGDYRYESAALPIAYSSMIFSDFVFMMNMCCASIEIFNIKGECLRTIKMSDFGIAPYYVNEDAENTPSKTPHKSFMYLLTKRMFQVKNKVFIQFERAVLVVDLNDINSDVTFEESLNLDVTEVAASNKLYSLNVKVSVSSVDDMLRKLTSELKYLLLIYTTLLVDEGGKVGSSYNKDFNGHFVVELSIQSAPEEEKHKIIESVEFLEKEVFEAGREFRGGGFTSIATGEYVTVEWKFIGDNS